MRALSAWLFCIPYERVLAGVSQDTLLMLAVMGGAGYFGFQYWKEEQAIRKAEKAEKKKLKARLLRCTTLYAGRRSLVEAHHI